MVKKALAVVSVLMGVGLGFVPWALHVTTSHLAFLALVLDGSAMVLFGFAVSTAGRWNRPGRRIRAPGRRRRVMGKYLSILTVLVGLALAITPWAFRFTGDHVALVDTAVGGIVVAALGVLTYQAMWSQTAPRPR